MSFNINAQRTSNRQGLGAIAAAFARGSEDAHALVMDMLGALSHRGTVTRTMKVGLPNSCIGYGSHKKPEPHVFETDSAATVIDGSIFRTSQPAKFTHARLLEGRSGILGARALLKEPGAFAAVHLRRKSAYVLRDLNGLKPLYYARDKRLTAFSSERKALWRIGLKNPTRVTPGRLYSIIGRKLVENGLAQFPRPREVKVTLPLAASRLSRLLSTSTRRITKGMNKLAVAFSGGLDSALVATLAKKTGSQVEAVSTGLPGSPELVSVEKRAQELDLPITIETFEPESLEEYVRRVIWLIEEPNLMKVSVAIPLHWAAKVVARRGFSTMLCGQGSDELYGGYHKYTRTLHDKGRRALNAELYESVLNSAQVNYERDDQSTAPFGVELRTPFADLDVIRYSMTIPSEYKVKAGDDSTRKWVLRTVAKNLGLPDDIVWRRKKAIQHGSGVENGIRKIAKSHGLTPDGYLSRVYQEVIRMESMP